MQKPSKLLKVVSIILIVIGGLGLLSSLAQFAMRSTIEQLYSSMGMQIPDTSYYIISLAGTLLVLICAIVGVMHKSSKSVLIAGIVLLAYYVCIMIYNIVSVGFSPLYVLNFILPVLFLWGWYRSN